VSFARLTQGQGSLMTRATSVAILMVGAIALSACGDDGQRAQTVTLPAQTVTAQAEPQTPSATTTAPESSAEDSTPAKPLPKGVTGADGTYTMRVKHSDYDEENLIVNEQSPSESDWKFATTCRGSTCSIRMMRQLESGGYKTLTLRPVAGRPSVFEGTATSSKECLIKPKKVATRQRYSIRLHSAADVNGRRTARRIDAFLTETTSGCTPGTRGVLSWHGALKG
jgi:hypothetical protein